MRIIFKSFLFSVQFKLFILTECGGKMEKMLRKVREFLFPFEFLLEFKFEVIYIKNWFFVNFFTGYCKVSQ